MSRLPPDSDGEARFLERLRRIDQALEPGPLELARARGRLGARAWMRSPRPTAASLPVAGAVILGAGLAFGVGLAVRGVATRAPEGPDESSVVLSDAGRGAPRAPSAARRTPASEETPPSVTPPSVTLPDGAPVLPPTPTKAPPTPKQRKPRPSWEPVAEALRSGDDRQAESRLLRLAAERGAEGAAAELALAQLRLRGGDVAGARPILERLARGSDDALVTRRARRALRTLSLRSTAHGGTQGEPKQ